ncbi:hypothetical protein [Flavobacterium sp.]|jgi:hypothetical protein|uniref:hypothetical protein n=1 Tax=Flavobacterium sp. TaxID=239 RepID=UPI0037C11363
MKTRKENQKNEKSKKFNLEKVEILKLDTMRKISGGHGGIGDDLTTTIKTVRQSTGDCR